MDQLDDPFAAATLIHTLANTYGTCHSCPVMVAPPPAGQLALDLTPNTDTSPPTTVGS
jgi:hypothetical protein